MRTVIVFESMFGNTEDRARDIAAGLRAAGVATTLVRRTAGQSRGPGRVRPARRRRSHPCLLAEPAVDAEDAVSQGADPARAAVGVREWLATLDDAFPARADRPSVAVFDTRVAKVRRLPGSAAKRAARVLRAQGFAVLDRPTSFYVEDVKGPALRGEPERAEAWGVLLAERLGEQHRRDAS